MIDWRRRMQARRRARRRYLATAFERWRAEGVRPPTHSRADQVLITLLWVLLPGVLAVICGAVLLVARYNAAPVEVRPELGLVALPMLIVWLLRGTLRR
jgi:hypothetical protein